MLFSANLVKKDSRRERTRKVQNEWRSPKEMTLWSPTWGSSAGNVLGHLAQMAERQGQLHQAQNEVLTDLAQSLAADRAMLYGRIG
ncbi:unnamed protein product [Boreogadus saida]